MQSILHAVHEPRRQALLRLTWLEEKSAGDLHVAIGDITFGAVSQHLRVLRDANLVTCRRDGRHRYYRANRKALGALRGWLEQMWTAQLGALAALVEAEARAEAKEDRS